MCGMLLMMKSSFIQFPNQGIEFFTKIGFLVFSSFSRGKFIYTHSSRVIEW